MPQPKSRKIAILGYRSVGKSSLTIQFVEGQFVDSYDPTIENTFTKEISVNGQEYQLQLVDTAGQDEFSIIPQTYSIDINGYILVYAVTSIKSFEVVKVIHEKLLDMVGKVQVPIMLVGNKKDLHMERVISYEEGKALAESWNAAFLESTAKENQVQPFMKSPGSAVPDTARFADPAEMLNPPIAASLSLRPRESSPCLNCHIYGGIQVFSPVTLVGSWFGLASVQQENMSQYSGKIIFYEGKCFTGRKLEVFGDCDNFQDRGFMNRVNSIRVETGAWICYDHPDFKGQQYILERGEYPDLHRWNGHNDHMGSCRPVRMHGERYRLELFEGCNFTGQCMEFHEDCPYLQGRGWNKNCVNACKVYGDGAWMLYEEPNYRGRMYIVERGDYRSFNEWQSQNANIQSVRRVVNYF